MSGWRDQHVYIKEYSVGWYQNSCLLIERLEDFVTKHLKNSQT